MILQFNFSNHKSFREEASLDLTAAGIKEYEYHVFKVGKEKILPITVIYGANASGKSNLIDAFKYMRYYVLSSFGFDLDDDKSDDRGKFVPPPYFCFDTDSRDKESTYEVYFIEQKMSNNREYAMTYNYGFTVKQYGIIEEWLRTKANNAKEFTEIFYRNKDEDILDLKGISKRQKENLEVSLRGETLVVSLGTKLKIEELEEIYDWFVKNSIVDFSSSIETAIREAKLPKGFANDENVRREVLKYLSAFDTDIVDFEITEGDSSKKFKVNAVHKSVDSNEYLPLPLRQESSGTLKMFSLYQYIKDVLTNGGVLFVDELNARLHPNMVSNIIHTFTNKELNPKGGQLIFTTHDAIQLDKDSLRRDEIWFVEKINGQSHLYSLDDFEDENGKKIRKDENYQKNYLVGKYGAIPNLKQISISLEK